MPFAERERRTHQEVLPQIIIRPQAAALITSQALNNNNNTNSNSNNNPAQSCGGAGTLCLFLVN